MTTRRVRTILAAMVAFVTVWPLAQFVLMRALGGTPWKLFGAAMYCTVHETSVELADVSHGAASLIPSAALSPATRAKLESTRRYRDVFGPLVEPRALAQQVLQELPEVETLAVHVALRRLNEKTATLDTRRTTYRYARSSNELGGRVESRAASTPESP